MMPHSVDKQDTRTEDSDQWCTCDDQTPRSSLAESRYSAITRPDVAFSFQRSEPQYSAGPQQVPTSLRQSQNVRPTLKTFSSRWADFLSSFGSSSLEASHDDESYEQHHDEHTKESFYYGTNASHTTLHYTLESPRHSVFPYDRFSKIETSTESLLRNGTPPQLNADTRLAPLENNSDLVSFS